MVLDELRHPIVLAPLAGGPATPALAAAVSEAGGLGFVAAGYKSAAAMRSDIAEVRAKTTRPFGVNVFVIGESDADPAALAAYRDRLQPDAERAGAALGELRTEDDDWGAKLDALRADRVPVVSFTFGSPDAEVLRSLADVGTETWVTITTPAEARLARDAGAAGLVLQGIEAGGHRGSFADDDAAEAFGLLALIRLVAAEIDLPLVAAGGIPDGAAVAAVLAAGARAAQLGTAFLRAPEAGTHAAQADALAADTPTGLTRAFTGRTARGLRNRFLDAHSAVAPRGYPEIHHLTAPIRAAARKSDDAGGFNLWAGQAHRLARAEPAAEIVERIAREAREAASRAASVLD